MNVSPECLQLDLRSSIVDHRNIRGTEGLRGRLDLDPHQLLAAPATIHTEQQARNRDQGRNAQPLPIHEPLLDVLTWDTRILGGFANLVKARAKSKNHFGRRVSPS
jgi:hypothetical protein